MSIISEALKKAQKERGYVDNDPIETEMSARTDPLLRKSGPSSGPLARRPFILFMAGAILLTVVSFLDVSFLFEGPASEGVRSADPGTALLPVRDVPGETPSFPAGGRFLITGIMYSDDVPQAVINGKIVAEGDLVDGYNVEKISRNTVKLSSSEDVLALELK